jgi:hypothetical protein
MNKSPGKLWEWFYTPDRKDAKSIEERLTELWNWFLSKPKIYYGLLSQTGTGHPTVSLFQNDVNAPGWVRTIAGTYTLTKTGAFPALKAMPVKAEVYLDSDGNKFVLTWVNANQYKLETYAAANTDVLADGVLVNRAIYIEINS